jgi:hypothetical protein
MNGDGGDFFVANAATRWIATQRENAARPPSGDGGNFFVANAATRWIVTQIVQAAHPPSGDGGYRKR